MEPKQPVKPPVAKRELPDLEQLTSAHLAELLQAGKVDEALRMIQVRKGLLDIKADEDQADENARLQAARLKAIQEEMERIEAKQSACPHTKQNGTPSIGGQRDSQNIPHWICLNCQKIWHGTLPAHLARRDYAMGGPSY